MRVNIQKTVMILFFLFLNISAFSHPHVFIDNAFTFIFDDKKNVYWVTIIPKVIVFKFRMKNE